MKLYAKIVNEKTKACDVGLGGNCAFYRRLGMKEMNVERGPDGQWYKQGYARGFLCCQNAATDTSA